ncbi:MAG: DUF3795 domain-containing protein [Pseudomonadota bacterium]
MVVVDKRLLAPCGLYCGVCGVLIAHRDKNENFLARLAEFYGCRPEDLHCEGCLSGVRAEFCRICHIRACTLEKGYEGCHQCQDWPCSYIEDFPLPVGKRVIMRTIPYWREAGTERFVDEEEKRYKCPNCGYILFRGAKRCRECQEPVDLD